MAIEQKYSGETRRRAVQRVVDRRKNEPRNRSIVREVAAEFDVGEQSLRNWVKRASSGELSERGQIGEAIDAPGQPLDSYGDITELQRYVEKIERDNAALKRTIIMLANELSALQRRRPESHSSANDLKENSDV